MAPARIEFRSQPNGKLTWVLDYAANRQQPTGEAIAKRCAVHQIGHDESCCHFHPHLLASQFTVPAYRLVGMICDRL